MFKWMDDVSLHDVGYWAAQIGVGIGAVMFMGTVAQLINGPPYIEGAHPHWIFAVLGLVIFVGMGKAARLIETRRIEEGG